MTGAPYSPTQLGIRPAPALVQQLLIGAFGWMFAGLLITAGVAFLVNMSEGLQATVRGIWFLLVIGQLGMAIGIQAALPRLSPTLALGLFFAFAATMGLTVGVITAAYRVDSVASAFLSASAMFGAAAIYGGTTKRELAGMGGYLFMGVIGLIVASVVNMLLGSGPLGFIISIVGVILFTVLTAYDVQRITRGDYAAQTGSMEKASVLAALGLYINFINIFLFLLRLLGNRD